MNNFTVREFWERVFALSTVPEVRLYAAARLAGLSSGEAMREVFA